MKEKHWAIVCKKTGETHFAVTGEDQHPRDCGYDGRRSRFFELDRAPTENDRFDGKKLKHCDVTKKRLSEHAHLNRMSRAELVDFITGLIDERIALSRGE